MSLIDRSKIIILLEENDLLTAAKELTQLYKTYPQDREILDTCLLIYNLALKEHSYFQPTTSEEYMFRAIVGRNDRDVFETLRDFGTAVNLNPENHYALKWRASHLILFGLTDSAKSDLNKAVEIYPCSEYYHELAKVYSLEEDYESSLWYQLKAIQHLSENKPYQVIKKESYYDNAGTYYEKLKMFGKAAEMFRLSKNSREGRSKGGRNIF